MVGGGRRRVGGVKGQHDPIRKLADRNADVFGEAADDARRRRLLEGRGRPVAGELAERVDGGDDDVLEAAAERGHDAGEHGLAAFPAIERQAHRIVRRGRQRGGGGEADGQPVEARPGGQQKLDRQRLLGPALLADGELIGRREQRAHAPSP